MKTVLITGGTGALGRTLSHCLFDRGYKVICTSRKPNSDDATVQMELSDDSHVSSVVQALRPEIVIHLAATFNSPFEDAYSVNVESARHLLNAIEAGNSENPIGAGWLCCGIRTGCSGRKSHSRRPFTSPCFSLRAYQILANHFGARCMHIVASTWL